MSPFFTALIRYGWAPSKVERRIESPKVIPERYLVSPVFFLNVPEILLSFWVNIPSPGYGFSGLNTVLYFPSKEKLAFLSEINFGLSLIIAWNEASFPDSSYRYLPFNVSPFDLTIITAS